MNIVLCLQREIDIGVISVCFLSGPLIMVFMIGSQLIPFIHILKCIHG